MRSRTPGYWSCLVWRMAVLFRTMKLRETSECPNCKRLARRVATPEKQLAEALERIAQLEQQLAAAKKDSSTSSKPPSSDIVKPKKPLPLHGSGTGAEASSSC